MIYSGYDCKIKCNNRENPARFELTFLAIVTADKRGDLRLKAIVFVQWHKFRQRVIEQESQKAKIRRINLKKSVIDKNVVGGRVECGLTEIRGKDLNVILSRRINCWCNLSEIIKVNPIITDKGPIYEEPEIDIRRYF